ncbi:MAG: mechanosensitive ion channel [Methanomicrobiaceae archaeon]|nr:mechanosensitive ion channel [Methanomicrobiaceae archaeon]
MANGIQPDLTNLSIREIDVGTILYIGAVLVIAYLAARMLSWVLMRLSERAGVYRISVTMAIPLLKIAIYTTALYLFVTAIIEPSLSQLTVFAGFFGAALGFGLKDVFADIIGGLVITFERPYQIGDKIAIKEHYGEVIDIGLRSTRIRTPFDSVVTIPNFIIFDQSVSSANAGKTEMMVVIDLFIDPESNAELAMDILKDAVVTSKYVYITEHRPYTILLDDFPFYKRVRAKAYVNDLRYEFEFLSEVTRRAWMAYAREGIRPPQVQRILPETAGQTARISESPARKGINERRSVESQEE